MPIPAAERIDSIRVCASLSHKATARLAGFGWIGKNCLLIHPVYGPRVRWATVLTDAPFEENRMMVEKRCESCDRCVKACPAQALKGRNFLDGEPRDTRFEVAADKWNKGPFRDGISFHKHLWGFSLGLLITGFS